jgi:hypothetical protein
MWRHRKRDRGHGGTAGSALAEPDPEDLDAVSLRAEIDALTAADPDLPEQRRLLRLRHLMGITLLDGADPAARFAEADAARLPSGIGLPEIDGRDVTAALVRAGILRDGCLLVRGLIPREDALRFAQEIERAYEQRQLRKQGKSKPSGYYEEFEPHARFGPVAGRTWIEDGGGLLAADSPRLSFGMFELFSAAGVPEIASGYLGEPALISVHKTTLRKALPSVAGAWHQDGFFMGPVRSLNLWLSLSRCGDAAPGLDIVPRRLDYLVTTATEEAALDYTISRRRAEEAAGEVRIIRPIFEPGDALFFDELFLHQTGSDPSMARPRFAIENWFFGAGGFPSEYAPLAV